MKTLQEECLLVVTKNLWRRRLCRRVAHLPADLKTALLECVLAHDGLTPDTAPYLLGRAFLGNLTALRVPKTAGVTDRFTAAVAASGCRLRSLSLVVPLNRPDERLAPLSDRGVRALFAGQSELEALELVWCINFKADVVTRIRSDFLRTVDVVGDAVCRCFEANANLLDKVHLCQRDFGFLAINNPTITTLRLDGVILDIDDCVVMFTALADSLERLEVKVVRYYAFCRRQHAFYGRDFAPFLQLVDRRCRRLRHLSCFALQTDVQDAQQVQLESPTLRTLCLEGHVFHAPLLLPPGLEKLKFSVSGYETVEHYSSLKSRAPNLKRLYVNFVDDFTPADEPGLYQLFSRLGAELVSLTNVGAAMLRPVSSLICDFCSNLKELGVVRAPGAGAAFTGLQLLPLFRDRRRAQRIRHLHLGLENLSQSLLVAVAENCRQLKTLDLAYCRTLDDVILTQIANNCAETLKVLDISLCVNVTDDGIRAVAQKCAENLEEIMLFQTKVGDKAVLALTSHCSKLRVCGIGPEQISQDMADILNEKCVQKILL